MRAAVIGSGAWGTALAIQLCRNGHKTALWFRNPEKAKLVRDTRCNPSLPGIVIPDDLVLTGDSSCVKGCQLVVIACPSFPIRQVCEAVAAHIDRDAVVASAVKGIEVGSHLRMSQVVLEITGHEPVVLTGPTHAEEVAAGIPTACLAAAISREDAEFVQQAFTSDAFRVYTGPDPLGAELGGALKNVIALCAGISDGLGFGDNTKAMLMTRGLTEIARLGLSLGAKEETFSGLAGIGDLIVTCTSMHSRNRRAGILIGQGATPEAAMEQVGAVVESYYAAKAAWELCQAQGVEMPILRAAYNVLYHALPAKEAVESLMIRKPKPESEDAGWK